MYPIRKCAITTTTKDWKDGLGMEFNGDLFEYVSKDVLTRILASFTTATGLHAIIVDREGYPILPEAPRKDSDFCKLIHSNPLGTRKCIATYCRAGEQAVKLGEPYIFRCHAGLVAFCAPIIIDGKSFGSIICDQVLMWEPEDFFWEEVQEMTEELDIEPQLLFKTGNTLEVFSGNKVQAAADLLYVVANQIMQSGMLANQQRKEIALRQTQLGEEIQNRKRLEQRLAEMEGETGSSYSLQKEKELMSMVRLGDRDGAYRLLNELVSESMEKYISKPPIFRVRILELLVVMSRSAAEAGADMNDLLGLNYQYMEKITKTEEVDELCFWIFKVMDYLVELIYGNSDDKNIQVLETATQFMRKSYQQNITLNDIAQAAFISPFYLSHIFKEKMNTTVMDYLTTVRMEQAKNMLRNPKNSMVYIAEQVGYSDPGYFSRVFKKTEGISPSAFKKMSN